MKKYIYFLLIGVVFCSCKNDATPAQVGTDKNKISKITATEVQLKDGTKIPYTNDANSSTIFVIRPGEFKTDEDRNLASLSQFGLAYSSSLANLFSEASIDNVLGIATRYASETVQPLADHHSKKVLTYNNTDYGSFLDYVFVIDKGSTFVVTETTERIPEILRTLTPGKKFPTHPKGLFNKLYMVMGTDRTQTTVHELYF